MSKRSSEQPSSTTPSSCVEIAPFGDLPDTQQQEVAEKIAYVTSHPDENGKMPQMLPVKPEDVMARVGFAAFVKGKFAGYIGIMPPEPSQQDPKEQMSEVVRYMLIPNIVATRRQVTRLMICRQMKNAAVAWLGS